MTTRPHAQWALGRLIVQKHQSFGSTASCNTQDDGKRKKAALSTQRQSCCCLLETSADRARSRRHTTTELLNPCRATPTGGCARHCQRAAQVEQRKQSSAAAGSVSATAESCSKCGADLATLRRAKSSPDAMRNCCLTVQANTPSTCVIRQPDHSQQQTRHRDWVHADWSVLLLNRLNSSNRAWAELSVKWSN